MILHRYVVSRVIWAYMLSIAVTYSITLCLFPGLESEIWHPTLGEWLPILIMATFNMSDFVGKVRRASVRKQRFPPSCFPCLGSALHIIGSKVKSFITYTFIFIVVKQLTSCMYLYFFLM